MSILQAAILGIIQGITEFLPVSSSGHLILLPSLLGWKLQSLAFDVVLHLGTSFAVLIYFRKDWYKMLSSLSKDVTAGNITSWSKIDKNTRLLMTILIVSIPVGLAGIFIEKPIEEIFRSPTLVATMLIAVSFVMFAADKYSQAISTKKKKLSFMDSLLISLSQILAMIPGTSRSGITISTALFRKVSRQESARFSFLLGTPIIVGGGLVKISDLFADSSTDNLVVTIGFFLSLLSGLLAIKWLLSFLGTHNLKWFVFYRILLGIIILVGLT